MIHNWISILIVRNESKVPRKLPNDSNYFKMAKSFDSAEEYRVMPNQPSRHSVLSRSSFTSHTNGLCILF